MNPPISSQTSTPHDQTSAGIPYPALCYGSLADRRFEGGNLELFVKAVFLMLLVEPNPAKSNVSRSRPPPFITTYFFCFLGELALVSGRMLNIVLSSSCRRTSGAVYPGVPHFVNVRSRFPGYLLRDRSFAKPKSTSLISP